MFGYIRPAADLLLVKDYALYRAVYCGVCRAMAKNGSPALSLSLRYDYVFAALCRILLTGEKTNVTRRRCAAHPLYKRPVMDGNGALSDTAAAAALFLQMGVQDGIRDAHGGKRLSCRAVLPYVGRQRKKALSARNMETLAGETDRALSALWALEDKTEASPDAAADPFGDILSAVLSAGFSGREQRIASSVGRHVGRFIYLCDAADDVYADSETGNYNPFAAAADAEGKFLSEWLDENGDYLCDALKTECRNAYAALCISENARDDNPVFRILENILTVGMVRMAENVCKNPGEKRSHRDIGAYDFTQSDS